MFITKYLFSWRHLKINLLLLLRLLALSALIMWCFSVRQKVASFGNVYICIHKLRQFYLKSAAQVVQC